MARLVTCHQQYSRRSCMTSKLDLKRPVCIHPHVLALQWLLSEEAKTSLFQVERAIGERRRITAAGTNCQAWEWGHLRLSGLHWATGKPHIRRMIGTTASICICSLTLQAALVRKWFGGCLSLKGKTLPRTPALICLSNFFLSPISLWWITITKGLNILLFPY